uniref:Epimerase family protein SDR39U1 n=1 Tax=Sipha flava TaxID=143950 RepID=A0A2S2PXF3_9HEMI
MIKSFKAISFFKRLLCKPMYCTLGHILIGGGTGFVGSKLRDILIKENYKVTVISRVKTGENHIISWEELIRNGIPKGITAVVNLTGESIMVPFKYFGSDYMQRIWISRVGSTMLLTDIINNTKCKPDAFITITSTGIFSSEYKYIKLK